MKSLIIIGVTRCGKTTLAEMICQKYHFSKIEQDSLIIAFQKTFPELGIGHWVKGSSEKFALFLFNWLERLVRYTYHHKTRYVVEGCQIRIDTIHKLMDHDNFKIVALGYPNQTPESMLAEIRKHDTENDWSAGADDEKLLWELDEYGVQRSQEILERCKELGITFIDTGTDRDKKLQDFVDNLETFLQ